MKTVKCQGKTFNFTTERGTVVSEPTNNGAEITFFLKTEDGKERDLTFNSSIKAREGHEITVIYAGREGADFTNAVAWINHTTDKADYFKDVAMKIVGDKLMTFFAAMSEASANTIGNSMDRHGGCAMIVIMPVLLMVLALGIACLAIAGLFGANSMKQSKAIINNAADIAESIEPSVKVYRPKKSKFLTVLKWILIIFIAWTVLNAAFSITGISDYKTEFNSSAVRFN